MKELSLFELLADMTRPDPPERISEQEREEVFNAAYLYATRNRQLISSKRKS